MTDYKYNRVTKRGPGDPGLLLSYAVVETCGHDHGTRDEANACTASGDVILESGDNEVVRVLNPPPHSDGG